MTRALIALTFVLVASSVHAQTLERTLVIDDSVLRWGQIDVEPINTDGDANTQEWLVYHGESGCYRVAAERPEGVCVGEWFRPWFHCETPLRPLSDVPSVREQFPVRELGKLPLWTVAGTSKLVTTVPYNIVNLYALDTPSCQQH